MDLNEIYCRWAEQKYNLDDVADVQFDDLAPVQGCETCGYGGHGPGIEVYVRTKSNAVHYFEEDYTSELINSLMEFVTNER